MHRFYVTKEQIHISKYESSHNIRRYKYYKSFDNFKKFR